MTDGFDYWDDCFRTDEARADYHKALGLWGKYDQLLKLAEECSELAAVTNKVLLGQADLTDLSEELIDARQTMEIVSLLYATEELRDSAMAQLNDFQERVKHDAPGGVNDD